MLKQRREKQQMELVIMEQMVPEDHFLRKVDRAVDFSFIYDLLRAAVLRGQRAARHRPEILFRMLLVGVFVRDQVRGAAGGRDQLQYRLQVVSADWNLTDKAPDATTISQNRRRVSGTNNIAEEIFNEILRQCEAKGLVGGAILYTDSTHIKAKANKHKKKLVEVAVRRRHI